MNYMANVTNFTSATFIGTALDLVNRKVKINNIAVDAVGLSILHKHGIIKAVGIENKANDKRGRAAKIFELKNSRSFTVSI